MQKVKTKGVCATEIAFDIEGSTIKSVEFVRGCPGNTMGLTMLLQGMEVEEAVRKLKGINCGGRGTSCPDQLATALENYQQANK